METYIDAHQLAFHEQLEHGTSERVGESCDVMKRQVHERAVRSKTAVGHKEV